MDTFLTFRAHLKPQLPDIKMLRHREIIADYNNRSILTKDRAAPLSTLSPSTKVHSTSYDQPGKSVKEADDPRSYRIEAPKRIFVVIVSI